MQITNVKLNYFQNTRKAKNSKTTNSINFRGQVTEDIAQKNPHQFMSIAPETKGNEMKSYDEGGLACVAKEAPESWYKDLKADIRTVLPYHATNNKDGMMKLAVFENAEEPPKFLPADLSNVRNVSPDYVPRKNERFVLINSSIDSEKIKDKVTGKFNTINKGYKFAVLEPTDVKGSIETLNEWDLVPEKLEYRFFKQPGNNKKEPKYYIHTKQVALMPRCYGLGSTYQTGQIAGTWWDLYYANFCRAAADALPQLAEKEGFNPANIWMHDRPAFAFQYEVAKRSARGEKFYNGLRMHSTLHNPGHSYQGYYENPIGFIRIAYDEQAFKKLQASPCYNELRLLAKKAPEKLTPKEIARRDAIIDKYFEKLKDDNKLGNITMMAIENSIINPQNSTVGTVSMNYGKEMKDENLEGIADGLTRKLNTEGLTTYDITNGNEPAALKLDIDGDFGRGGNNLTLNKSGYSRYSPVIKERNIIQDGKVVGTERVIINYSPEERDKIIADGVFVTTEEKLEHERLTKELDKREEDLNYKVKEQELKDLHQEIHGNSALSKTKKEEMLEEEKQKQKTFDEIQKKYNEGDVPDKKRKLDCIFEFKTVKEAKLANKKWLLNLISKSADKDGNVDNEELRKVFYNEEQMNNGLKAHGYISDYKEGDKVFTSWGRADEQKGFATLLQGFYKYLTQKGDEEFEAQKSHTKLLFGSAGKFKEDRLERKIIYEYIDKIEKLDGGKYKGNVCFVEGFFPNKLVAASDWTIFTSRYEPCGITPLESFAAGVPVLSIKTGGAPDFVKHLNIKQDNKSGMSVKDTVGDANGILTEDPFMLSPKTISEKGNPKINKDFDSEVPSPEELDEARREILSDEIADLFKKANSVSEEVYDQMAKNACKQQIEWTKNKDYNGGSDTANDRYMKEVFGLDPKTLEYDSKKPRNMEPLKSLTGEFKILQGSVDVDEDPIEVERRDFCPSFGKNLKKYNTLSSIIAYSKI